jgi:hypothetical protein
MSQIDDLELELRDQEEKARRHEEAALAKEWQSQSAYVDEVRKQLSTRINELEAQQSGQISISEHPTAQPRPTQYYCEDCCWWQMELRGATQKSQDFGDKCRLRKTQLRGMDYRLDKVQEEARLLQKDLDAANREVTRLRAELGLRTSKL